MKNLFFSLAILLIGSVLASAQTVDEIIAKYVKTIGGMDKINALKTLTLDGKFIGGGGFEAVVKQENKRPNLVREEFTFQAMTGVNAYNGTSGWKIQPWGGKKDPEPLNDDELRGILFDADFDGPLIDYKAKGNTVQYMGMEPVEGTDAIKLEVKLANGDIYDYFLDTDYYVPIQIDVRRFIRGSEQNFEITLGDYKEVNGVYFPFSQENGQKGSQFRSKTNYESMQANLPMGDEKFNMPPAPAVQTATGK